jgi:hypothetical protein
MAAALLSRMCYAEKAVSGPRLACTRSQVEMADASRVSLNVTLCVRALEMAGRAASHSLRVGYEKGEKRPNGKEASKRPCASPCAMCGVVCAGLTVRCVYVLNF